MADSVFGACRCQAQQAWLGSLMTLSSWPIITRPEAKQTDTPTGRRGAALRRCQDNPSRVKAGWTEGWLSVSAVLKDHEDHQAHIKANVELLSLHSPLQVLLVVL